MILGNLNDLNHLLSLRLVSKRFDQLVRSIRTTSLSVHVAHESERTCNYDFNDGTYKFTNEPIRLGLWFQTKKLHFLKSSLMQTLLCKLRQLSIDIVRIASKTDWSRFETNINHFIELDQLQIENLELDDPDTNKLVNLRNIESLSIQEFTGQRFKLKAAKLRKLDWNEDLDHLELIYPANITHLRLARGLEDNQQFNKLKTRFKGLSHLYIGNYDYFEDFSVFSNFPKLKEVYYPEIEKEMLVRLIKQKKISRNLDLKLYFNFFRIDDLNDIDDIFNGPDGQENLLEPVRTRVIIDNYEKLASAVDFEKMDYSALIDRFGTAPADFTEKFFNIQKIVIGQPLGSQTDFIAFLRKCKLLIKLKINDARLDRAFYSDLSVCCPYIISLKVILNSVDLIDAFDPSFLSSLKFLVKFSINQPLDSQFFMAAFKGLKALETMSFILNGKRTVFKFDYSQNLEMIFPENDEDDGEYDVEKAYKRKVDCLAALEHMFRSRSS